LSLSGGGAQATCTISAFASGAVNAVQVIESGDYITQPHCNGPACATAVFEGEVLVCHPLCGQHHNGKRRADSQQH
jgi:hypothetical protein